MEEKKKLKLVVKPFDEDRQFPVLGKPKELKPGIYGVKNAAVIGKIYAIPCPKCDQHIIIRAKKPGLVRVKCPSCKTLVAYRGTEKEESTPVKENKEKVYLSEKNTKVTERVRIGRKKRINGKLVWGGLFCRKTYVLHEGENYIGREDKDLPSDVSLKDEYASRRSIKIEVLPGNKGYSFKLTVENATNPILVNGQNQTTGNSVYLNFGDTIVLGNTTIRFKESKK